MLVTTRILFILVSTLFVFGRFDDFCPEYCECTGLSASCRGDNRTFFDVLGSLPTDTESFTFTFSTSDWESRIDFNSETCIFSRLKHLKKFQIQPETQDQCHRYSLGVGNECKHIFDELKMLTHLRLNVRTRPLYVDTIKGLRSLTLLDLSYTASLRDLVPYLLSANLSWNIDTLLLRYFQDFSYGMTEFKFSLFCHPTWHNLEVLDLADNAIPAVSTGLLCLGKLRKLDLSGNLLLSPFQPSMATALELVIHGSLQEVHMTNQGIGKTLDSLIPYTWNGAGGKQTEYSDVASSNCKNQTPKKLLRLPSSRLLSNESSDVTKWDTPRRDPCRCLYDLVFPLGRHINRIDVSGFLFNKAHPYENPLPRGCFCFNPNNNLEVVDLSRNQISRFLERPDFPNFTLSGLHRLHWLSLQKNDLALPLQSPLFGSLPSLRTLLLGGNHVQLHNNDTDELLKTLPRLETLDLSSNQLSTIPYYEFSNLCLKTLNLSGNMLQGLNFTLPRSGSLRLLDISNNQLSFLSDSLISQLDAFGQLEVNIQNNHLVCGCETLNFVRWVQSTETALTGKENLSCSLKAEQVRIMAVNSHQLHQDCNPLSAAQIALIAVAVTACCFGLSLLTRHLYRKRWRIRYFWYRRHLQRVRAERQMDDTYEYNAFISFSEDSAETRDWIQTSLQTELEDIRGLKLFIPERDMEYGRCLLTGIDEEMGKCRKVILVLSPEYLNSWECLYEAWSVTTTMVSEDRDAAILVKLQALPVAGIPGTLTSLMETRECFTWTGDLAGQQLFWERLYDSLLSCPGSVINE